MYVSNQVIDFIEFVLIGVLIASIFDFFRAYRKIKKVKEIILKLNPFGLFSCILSVRRFTHGRR